MAEFKSHIGINIIARYLQKNLARIFRLVSFGYPNWYLISHSGNTSIMNLCYIDCNINIRDIMVDYI